MHIQIQEIIVPLDYDEAALRRQVSRKAACAPELLSNLKVVRRSLDARPRRPGPVYVATVEADLKLDRLPDAAQRPGVECVQSGEPVSRRILSRPVEPRPVVVGAGPAGLMAAYALAVAGARPLLLERGEVARARAPVVARFWRDGTLDPESNVLFGEGGAGLFSDGKLTARSKERGRVREFMQLLHACGADESVLMDAEPHVGSDCLLEIVPRLRERIREAGGEVRFHSRLDNLLIEEGRLRAVIVNGQEMACRHCVLAVGHSARDVHAILAAAGVALKAKPFAVGVRLELPQAAINRAQYGRFAPACNAERSTAGRGNPLLGAASFRLTRREGAGLRACYSFCMCPGGTVIACASEPGLLAINGMSYSKRLLSRGNAAFLVPVGPPDYPEHPIPALAGVAFQQDMERKAFAAAGGGYVVPASRLGDFLAGKVSADLPEDRSCVRAAPSEFRTILPETVAHTLQSVLPAMLKDLKGVSPDAAVLYAVETRSSSPLWMVRDDEGESAGARGLFPAGEGSGYAGGIVSSAVDGMRAAESVLKSMG
ncbi:MAG: FAD-binding protein, partial [Lentisphaerae bacterium]|nr:FAD-binding protein [Lentisphaerota bacterium]